MEKAIFSSREEMKEVLGYDFPNYDRQTKKLLDPHVVILGAGASIAAFPNGDKNGCKTLSMNELSKMQEVQSLLSSNNYKPNKIENFESFYSKLSQDPKNKTLCQEIEKSIFNYYSKMELPKEPTIYDYLILSLTSKDLIASFNWDPLLVQALNRNLCVGNCPQIVFLHGNVGLGVCMKHKNIDYIHNRRCKECGEPLENLPLLYPIEKKDYNQHGAIRWFWNKLNIALEYAVMLTIFGYSAPKTDIEAIKLIKEHLGNNSKFQFLLSTVVDIKEKSEIHETWKNLVFMDRFDFTKSIESSWLWHHVRNSGEAITNANLQQHPIKNPAAYPKGENKFKTLEELQEFVKKIKIENIWFSPSR